MRMQRINMILEAGQASFGDRFEEMMNHELVRLRGAPLRRIQAVHIRPSEDIGAIAAHYAASGKVKVHGPIAKRIVGRFVTGEARHESDLLSYLLFDGNFAGELIALGRTDAAKKEDELAALFDMSAHVPASMAVK
jgi:NTE family protein